MMTRPDFGAQRHRRFFLPEKLSFADASEALALIRWHFRTFPFADANTMEIEGLMCVDAEAPLARMKQPF